MKKNVASPGLLAGLTVLAALAVLGGCAHETGGGGGGGGGGGYFDDCGDAYGAYAYSGHHRYAGVRSYEHPCGWYGWEPSNFYQTSQSAIPARAQVVSETPRRPHPREVGWRGDDSSGSGSTGSSGSGSSASSGSGSIQLSQPSPSFSSPPAPAPPAPASPPSSRRPN